MIGGSIYLYVLLEISPNLPSTQPYSFGKSVLTETNGAGAPFPHCCAAHGASGGPRLPPEAQHLFSSLGRAPSSLPHLTSRTTLTKQTSVRVVWYWLTDLTRL